MPSGGGTKSNEKTVVYLVDVYNHTGFAQVLEELTFNYADPDPLTDTPASVTTYTIGDDIIAQDVDGTTEYLLYDGHGSTRQLADSAGAITDTYAYDAYGVTLGTDNTATANAGTSYLYAGEQYDASASMYYNRARYYNQNNGRFNRTDPYAGNMQDPQSLHKYTYCHANPVNGIDPSGLFASLVSITIAISVTSLISGLVSAAVAKVTGGNALKAFITTTMTVAFGSALSFIPGLTGPVAFALGALFTNLIWEGYVEGFRESELSAMRIVVATLTAFMFSYLVSLKFPALSAGINELAAIIDSAGLRPLVSSVNYNFPSTTIISSLQSS